MIDTFVVISMDGIRREALTPFGVRFPSAPFPRTPAINRLARNGVRFDQTFTTSSFALAARISLLTGLEPPRHGLRSPTDTNGNGTPSIAARLADRGFATAYLSTGPEVPPVRGFADTVTTISDGRCGVDWLRSHHGPALLWFQEDSGRDGIESPQSQIERTVRVDALVETWSAAIAATGRADRTLFVVTSDRAREMDEPPRASNPHALSDDILRVPLLLSGGTFHEGIAIANQVRTVDITPTLLELAGITDIDIDLDGVGLAPQLEEGHDRVAYAETPHSPVESWACLRRDGWKLVWNRLTGDCHLWCPEADPRETLDFAGIHPEMCRQLADSITSREREELLVDTQASPVAHESSPRFGLP